MRLEDLQQQACRQVARLISAHPEAEIRAEPVLNYGGFVNRSFRVATPEGVYHVKLTDQDQARARLQCAYEFSARLATDYRAPPPRGWIRIPDSRFSGPMFQWIDGTPPTAPLSGAERQQVVAAVRRLHGDADLAARLDRSGSPARSCAAAYRTSYHERFVEDLAFIRRHPPGFVTAKLLDELERDVEELLQRVDDSAAFARPATHPTHGDLWVSNLLVAAEQVFILDWDELAIGDPAMDWAMLFGPSRDHLRPVDPAELENLPLSDDELERVHLFRRASLLDWVIDPLADWVAAGDEPEHGTTIRRSNRRVHQLALLRYRELWP